LTNTFFRFPCGSKDGGGILHRSSIFGNFEGSPLQQWSLRPHFGLSDENYQPDEDALKVGNQAHFLAAELSVAG
jgi:hypothetical protein